MEGLIDTRNEYIEHIQDIIAIPLSQRIYDIWCDCSKIKGSIKEFQKELIQIKKWNNNIIYEEYKKIIKKTKCKYLHDLIKMIIITTIKIKIYEYKDNFNNIKIKIPLAEDFIHKCYINISIFSWKNAYLFNNKNIKDSEYQNNLNIIEENIRIIIKKTFRDFIPFDDIFQQIQDNIDNIREENTERDISKTKLSKQGKTEKITTAKALYKSEEEPEEEPEIAQTESLELTNSIILKQETKNVKNNDKQKDDKKKSDDKRKNSDINIQNVKEKEDGEEVKKNKVDEEVKENEDDEEIKKNKVDEEVKENEDDEVDEEYEDNEDVKENDNNEEGEEGEEGEEEEDEDNEDDEDDEEDEEDEDDEEDEEDEEDEDDEEDDEDEDEDEDEIEKNRNGVKNGGNIITISNSTDNDEYTTEIYKKGGFSYSKKNKEEVENTLLPINITQKASPGDEYNLLQKREAYENIDKKLSVEKNNGSKKNSEIKEIVINDDNNVKGKKLRFF